MCVLGSVHCPSEKQSPALWGTRGADRPQRKSRPAGATHALLVFEAGGYWEAKITLVIGINQTNHSTNQERPCTTVQRIKKGLSVCQSLPRSDPVTFPVLSQIKPHTPRLVVSFRQLL